MPLARNARQEWMDMPTRASSAQRAMPKIVILLDGEDVALKAVIEVLLDLGVEFTVVKLPAATSGSTQPCDVSPIFKIFKASWKKLDRKSTRLNSSHPRLSRMPSSA